VIRQIIDLWIEGKERKGTFDAYLVKVFWYILSLTAREKRCDKGWNFDNEECDGPSS
jgi:hypothetical protein